MRRSRGHDSLVVIGGGISGLSSAFYLLREAKARGRQAHVTIIDPAPRLGGKINTLKRDGFVIERGPDSFLARKQPMIDLARELGIEGELTGTNPEAKKTYILHRGKLHPMPPGLVLGIPTEIAPFAKTSLLTWGGKLRAMMDFVLPSRKETGDESLGGFLERRLGTEVMERVAEPLLAGIYAGDLRKLSLQATFPQFGEAERKRGSLIRGMRASKRAGANTAANPSSLPGAAGKSVFLTFKGGLSTIVMALEEALSGTERRLGVKAVQIIDRRKSKLAESDSAREGQSKLAGGPQAERDAVDAVDAADAAADRAVQAREANSRYEVVLSNGETIEADGIVVTTPAYDAAELLGSHVNTAALEAVRYVSVANVVMAFDKATFGREFDGSGFVVPRSEGMTITACTWTSAKWLHTSPDDKVLLRCYVGRSGDEAIVDLPDDQLAEAVRHDIREVMGITAVPLFTEITRLHRSMPQYPVGHLQHIAAMRKELESELPGVWTTGAAFDGVGLPDCIRQGKEAAVRVYEMI
ncbi:Protoporphyrinogen oxidase [Paenibacillus plantiphilus]|uniref:Coproporphyrinogen III oxidase n=1 Tax=Paenibacillus plantiphilus TaxID=2905650 RepID=A0ABN8G9Z1_9BACL|nr:protoporphyrinogen oxidase [Paenibacillus plantiphilus]CAH1204104.1 Protoporphyrinogen oxidase [Paenibacillus plantiphilus]